MITEEEKLNSQNVGLDLTLVKNNDTIISGYLHFEKMNNIDKDVVVFFDEFYKN